MPPAQESGHSTSGTIHSALPHARRRQPTQLVKIGMPTDVLQQTIPIKLVRNQGEKTSMPSRDPKPANGRRKSKLKLDMPEPELAEMLHQYCDLRRRGFDQAAIKTKSSWTKNHQKLLLEEAQRRAMPGSQKSQELAVTEWLLAMYDAGAELRVIQRTSALSNLQTKNRLQAALDDASGPAPNGLIIRNPDGTPARVSWLAVNGTLTHRPFDGAFPPDYPTKLAIRQCTEVTQRLVGQQSKVARDRAYTMLLMAEDGLHSFDYDAGRQVYAKMEAGHIDDDAKRTVILNLHSDPNVAQLLLQRCGISSRWLTSNEARTLSRRLRDYEYSPAFTRNAIEHLGHDPDTYYIIGADYRIPEPSPDGKAHVIQALQKAGFSDETIESALSTLGVPPGGHHPPKRSSKKQA